MTIIFVGMPPTPSFVYFNSNSVLYFAFSYTLFPLLLLLDAAVDCRSVQKRNSEEKSAILFAKNNVSDAVSEGVLQCLEELLTKCCLGSVNQVVYPL